MITLVQGVVGRRATTSRWRCGARHGGHRDRLRKLHRHRAPRSATPRSRSPLLASVIQSKPDAILIAPNDRVAHDRADPGRAQRNMPFSLATPISRTSHLANIASDNVLGGTMAAEALAKLINETGSVYLQNTAPGVSTMISAYRVSRKRSRTIRTSSTLASTSTTMIRPLRPRKPPRNFKISHLAGIFGTNLFSAEGAATAVKEASKTGLIKIVGFDAGPQQVQDFTEALSTFDRASTRTTSATPA